MEKSPLEQIAELSEREARRMLLAFMENRTLREASLAVINKQQIIMKYHAVYLTSYGHEIVGDLGFDTYEQAMRIATSVAESLNHTLKYIIAKPC